MLQILVLDLIGLRHLDQLPIDGIEEHGTEQMKSHIGFLAQEALAVEKANGYGSSNDDSLIVNLTSDGMSYGMKYERLVPILVNAIKELSTKVTALEAG